jgi:hypothetical protein
LPDDGNRQVTALFAQKIELKILDWSPLPDDAELDILMLHDRPADPHAPSVPKTGFLGFLSDSDGIDLGPMKLYWVLMTHNLSVSDNVLNAMLSPSGASSFENLLDSYNPNTSLPDSTTKDRTFKVNGLAFTGQESWLFGAAFSIIGVLDRCAFVLQDQHYYGINLASSQPWFKELFGTDQFTLAYMPGPTKQQDRFRVEFALANLNFLGALRSGLVALEYGLNRDFLLDFGFPWKVGNTYLWDRTFSMLSGIYETRFGFYFEKRTVITQRGTELTIGAGIAVSYGYHVGVSNGIAYAEAGISVTVILTGQITFLISTSLVHPSAAIKEIVVVGVIGLYAYAKGGINLWVITAELRAEVVAALAGTLRYLPNGGSSLTFDATLSVAYSASCRVKMGFFSVSFSVAGHLSYGVSGRIGLN